MNTPPRGGIKSVCFLPRCPARLDHFCTPARPSAPFRTPPSRSEKREKPTRISPVGSLLLSLRSSPAAPRRRRGWRRRRWRGHSPVMRGRGRRWRHPPMVAVVMMRDHAATHVSSGERGSGECDCGKGRDKFDLVHGVVPFFVWGYVFRQIEAPISPPTSPPRSEAPISHQSSVWSVVL